MRLHCFLLLAAVAVFNVDASRKQSIATANGFLSKRLLRTVDTLEQSEDSVDEERMNVPGLDTVTSAISSTITKGKVNLWLVKGEDADDALELFKLHDGIEKLRDTTNFNTYASYVRKYNAQNPDHEVSMLAAIVARYGDDETAKLLQTMTKYSSTQNVAMKLSREQVDLWVAAKKTPKEVFALLKLDKNVDYLLSSSALYSMDDFLNAYNRQHKNQHTSLMKVVLGSYDDAKVAKALQDGLESASTKSRAWELKERQFDDWIRAGIKPKEAHADIFGGSVQPWEEKVVQQYKEYYKVGKKTLSELDEI